MEIKGREQRRKRIREKSWHPL